MPETIKGGHPTGGPTGKKLMALWHGHPGSGKTAVLLSYPPPIHMVNFDRDPSHLFVKLPAHYEVIYETIPYDIDFSPSIASAVLHKVDTMVAMALKYAKEHPDNPGSFALDGSDILWDIVKIAKLPSSDASARQYADANAYMYGLLGKLYNTPMHVGLSAISKEIWKRESAGTGTYDPVGFSHRARWLTHECYLFSPEDTAPRDRPVDSEVGQTHRAYFQRSKVNEKLVRSVTPNISFKMLYKLAYGELPKEHEKLWTPS